jgi:hypothetical protein
LGVGLTTPPCKTWICPETSTEASVGKGRRLGGHGPKTGRSAIEEEEVIIYMLKVSSFKSMFTPTAHSEV